MTAPALFPASMAAVSVAGDVRDAIASRAPLRIRGGGTWLDAGWPVRADRPLSLAPLAGIVEYIPGDLTLTVLAGTSMVDIAAATAPNGQWLPLDPFGPSSTTLGAVLATGSMGPLAHAHGGPRDQALGIECVLGTGEIVRGGGRVTKNVAGFDLTRLLIGSWGTLGAITEITIRLRARPPAEMTLAIAVPEAGDALAGVLRSVRTAPLEALAIELLDRSLSMALGLGDTTTLLVRLGGNAGGIAAQRATLAMVGDPVEVGAGVWASLREVEPTGAWAWRMSDLPARIADTWAQAQRVARMADRCWIHATVSRGIVRCVALPQDGDPQSADALALALANPEFRGTVVFERLPPRRWPTLARPAASDPVSRRIRRAFDPHALLNPGILGEDAP